MWHCSAQQSGVWCRKYAGPPICKIGCELCLCKSRSDYALTTCRCQPLAPVFCALGYKNRALLLYSRFFFCCFGLTNKTKFPFKCIGKSDIKTSLGSHYISANTKCFPLKDKKGVSEWRCNKAVKVRDTVCVFQYCIYITDKVLYSYFIIPLSGEYKNRLQEPIEAG